MSFARSAVLLAAAAACTSTPPPTTPGVTPAPDPAPAPAPAAFEPSQLGASCAEGQACTAGATCKAYYGFAGASGPEFKTCEIGCDEDPASCPAGTTCVTISDGAGTVCRPIEG